MSTTAGDAAISFTLDGQRRFTGNISTSNLNLKRLLDNDKFGNLAANIEMDGQLAQHGPSVTAKGVVNRFDYQGYQYQNIDLNGTYSPNNISGRLTINDPNLGFDIEGQVKPEGKTNVVNITKATTSTMLSVRSTSWTSPCFRPPSTTK